jgi:hypothetical protein
MPGGPPYSLAVESLAAFPVATPSLPCLCPIAKTILTAVGTPIAARSSPWAYQPPSVCSSSSCTVIVASLRQKFAENSFGVTVFVKGSPHKK